MSFFDPFSDNDFYTQAFAYVPDYMGPPPSKKQKNKPSSSLTL